MAGNPQQSTRQRIEMALGVMLRLMRQFLGAGWQPRRVCFEHPAPRDLGAHQRLFGRCVEFGCDFNCIVCAKADLDARNPSADPAMARYAQQLLDASANPQQGKTMLEDVRRTILLLLPSGRCTIEQVAEYLGVVCRTIQRRLAERGQSFSSLVNDIRKELATRHVIESDRPLVEVAMLLGFSAPSGFSRRYHGQFGCSAKESRPRAAPCTARQRDPLRGPACRRGRLIRIDLQAGVSFTRRLADETSFRWPGTAGRLLS